MAVTTSDTFIDRFVRFLETAADPDGVIHPDVFVDINVPHWRFQLQGARAVRAQLADDSPNGATITIGRCERTESGFVVECAYRQDDHVGPATLYRTVWMVTTRDGRVTEMVLYCTGEWSAETQARQAAEAPMIRSPSGVTGDC